MSIFILSGCLVSVVSESMLRAQARAINAEEKNKTLSLSHKLFENSPTAVFAIDAISDRVVQANHLALSMFAYSADEILTKTIADLTYPEDLAESLRRKEQLSKGLLERMQFEKRYVRKDGTTFWAESSISSLRDDKGAVTGFIASTVDISERKRTEAVLLDRQLKLDAVINNSPSALSLKTPDGHYALANPNLQRIHHLPETEIIGKTDFDLYPDNIACKFRENDEQVMSTRARLSIEELVPVEGQLRNYMSHIFPVFDEYGSVRHICRISLDITERKKMEQSLVASEKEFRLLAEAMPQIVWICDPDGRNVYFNQQWVDYTGQTLEESYGHGWNTPFHPDDQQRAWDQWNKAVANNANYSIECRLRRADGEYLWWLIRGVPVLDADGRIEKWFGTCTDINEIKISQQKLLVAATAFESHEGMIITDAHSFILQVNQAFTNITGYSAQEVIGKKPSILGSGRQDAKFYAVMWKKIRDTGSWEGEIWNRRKNGEIYPEYLIISAVKGQNGIVTNYVGALTDTTERQRALEQLRITADELAVANAQIEMERASLAERVLERTAQLQMANHAKDSFLATMSHEIRTPLTGLIGMMELLSLSKLEQEQIELLRAAQGSGNSLLRIVNDILDWSKIEAGKLELERIPATLSDLLKGVVNTYSQLASKKSIYIKVEIDPELSSAHLFDPLRVSQILNNFTSNAIKFTEHGTIKLSATCLARHDEKETINFSVQDSGVGITPEQQSRIFKQYEQASAETARMYGGTGLGLAICHKLAELMGGILSVESTTGVGSTFSFTVDLPVADQAAQEHLLQSSKYFVDGKAEPNTGPLAPAGRTIDILIVDDHPINRMLLKQQLELLGIHVEAAESGTPALLLWQNRHFDIIITDCHMPEMDGYELASHIRATEAATGAKRIPIIAWTANVMVEEVVHCQAAGMDGLLTKPTELPVLRAKMLKWLIKSGVLQQ